MPTELLTAGASIVGGLLNKPKKTVAQPLYTPAQLQAQSELGTSLSDEMANPASLNPEKVAAASNVNREFDNTGSQLESQLAGSGFGNSGKLVTNMKNVAVAKAGAQGSLESQFAALQLDQQNKTRAQMQQFAFSGPGSTTTVNQPGGALGGAIAGGSETASLLYTLNHLMGGGGAPGTTPAPPGSDPSENWDPSEAEGSLGH